MGSSWSVVLRKQILPHSNITPCHGTRSFVTVLTRARHLSLLRICVKESCSGFCFRCRAVFVVGSQFLQNRIRHRGSNNHRQPHNPIPYTTPYVRLPYYVPPPPQQQSPSTKSKFVFFGRWHWGSPPSLSLPLRINQSVRELNTRQLHKPSLSDTHVLVIVTSSPRRSSSSLSHQEVFTES